MNNKKVKRTETYLFFDFEGRKLFVQSILLMIMMFSTTSNPLMYLYISLNFCIDGLSVIISYYPCPKFKIAKQVIQKFRSKEASLKLGSYNWVSLKVIINHYVHVLNVTM